MAATHHSFAYASDVLPRRSLDDAAFQSRRPGLRDPCRACHACRLLLAYVFWRAARPHWLDQRLGSRTHTHLDHGHYDPVVQSFGRRQSLGKAMGPDKKWGIEYQDGV